MGSFDKQLLRNRASPTPPEMLESDPSVNAVRCSFIPTCSNVRQPVPVGSATKAREERSGRGGDWASTRAHTPTIRKSGAVIGLRGDRF